jgi:hypothetical protein
MGRTDKSDNERADKACPRSSIHSSSSNTMNPISRQEHITQHISSKNFKKEQYMSIQNFRPILKNVKKFTAAGILFGGVTLADGLLQTDFCERTFANGLLRMGHLRTDFCGRTFADRAFAIGL